jgi:hypothetical protein
MKKNNEIWYGLKTRTFSLPTTQQEISLKVAYDNLKDKELRGFSMRSHVSGQKDRYGKQLLAGKNFFLNLVSDTQETLLDALPYQQISKHSESNVRFYPSPGNTSLQYSKFILESTLDTTSSDIAVSVIEITVHYDEPAQKC